MIKVRVPKEERTSDNKLYQRLKKVHYGMMDRCYYGHCDSYKNYGKRGVTVDPKWWTLDGFLDDVDKIEGWDKERYLNEHLSLDKDKKWGNKIYNLENCRFVTPEENNKVKPNQQYRIVGFSPLEQIIHFHNTNEFSKRNGLNGYSVIRCAKGEQVHVQGWQFCLEEDYDGNNFVDPYSWETKILGLSPEGELYEFWNASQFARDHNLLEATVIYGCANLKNTHTRGWQFRFKEDLAEHPFLPREELIIVGKRNRRVLATFPDGKTEVITNRSKFSRDHNLNRKSMYEVLSGKRTEHRGYKFEFIDK